MTEPAMPPEIEAKYRQTLHDWKAAVPAHPPPLPFVVPEERRRYVSVADRGMFDSPLIDEHRCFAGNPGGGRMKWMWVQILSGVGASFILFFAVIGFLYKLKQPERTEILPIEYWIIGAICSVLFLLAKYLRTVWPRKANYIFDRDKGLLYIPGGPHGEHVGVDFYRQYFFLAEGMTDAVDYVSLRMYVRDELGQGRGFSHPIHFFTETNERMALHGWHFLLRFMDKTWPFKESEYRFFEYELNLRKKQGFRLEGLRFADGTVEVIGKGIEKIPHPRWDRAMAEFNGMLLLTLFVVTGVGGVFAILGIGMSLLWGAGLFTNQDTWLGYNAIEWCLILAILAGVVAWIYLFSLQARNALRAWRTWQPYTPPDKVKLGQQ